MLKTAFLATVATVALVTAASASAQAPSELAPAPADAPQPAPAPGSQRTTTYDAAFFAQFAPRTALDIAERVPGFTLDLGNNQSANGQDVRGFAGTAGNVVINGARPSTKAETLDTTLSRIPAQRVIRVEVGPGDIYGSDYAGKSQVLNVVLSQAAGIDANVTASARRWYTGYVNTDIEGSALIRRGPSTINLSAGTGRNRQLEEGTDTFVNVGTGELVEFRRKHNSYFNKNPFVAGSWALERAADNAMRINARWQPSTFDLFQDNRVFPTGGAAHDDNLIQRYRDPVIELGGDLTRPLAGGAIKFVALATRRKRNDFDQYIQHDGLLDEGAAVNGGFDQTIRAKRNETIGRLSWTRSSLFGLSFEAGAEAAYNTLDDKIDLFEVNEEGERERVNLPIADATVKEKRGEVYVNVGKSLSPALRIDGGVNYEFSNLTVRGDAEADRTLKFLKPNLTLDWKPGGGWHTQFSVRRTVAQLNFYDFFSFGDLSAQRVTGSNANLQPQRAWELRATVEHPLFGDGLFKLDVGSDLISKVQDQILIIDDDGKAFSGPGNLGKGTRIFATLTVDAPLGMIWSGLRTKFTSTLQRTRVDDPISGRPRQFSDFFPNWQWSLDVRRDAGKFSYGFNLSDRADFTFFRTDEYDRNFNGGIYGTAFVEYRFSPKTSLTLDLDNALNTTGNRERLLFRLNRANPTSIFDELRERNRHVAVGLTLKQSFGGGGVAK